MLETIAKESMTDTIQILEAIAKMHKAINISFDKVYAEIKVCDKRVTKIEGTLAIKKAVCEERKEKEKERKEKAKTKRDFWKPAIRTITIVGVLALLALAWAKIKAVLDLVP